MNEILKLTLSELAEKLDSRELSSRELTKAYLQRIESADRDIGAFLELSPEAALKAAANVDSKRINGEKLHPLSGIPVGIKDNISTRGLRTTCASKMLENFIPPYDAHVIERLKSSDAIIIGKLNMDEFAMGSSTESSYFKKTHNPHRLECVPGGSSGGSAAAVASFEVPYSLGSDTGGSIRQPAAFCGVVGMKPTYGRVSRYGLIAFASSLDQIGPITANIRDNALVLTAISGHDERDSTSANRTDDFLSGIENGVKGLRIGIPDEFFAEGISPEVKSAVLKAAEKFEKMGAELVRLSMKSIEYALPAYYVISSAEASSNLARYDGVRYGRRSDNYEDISSLYENSRSEGFGTEVKRRIMLGTFVLSAGYYDEYYRKALRVRDWVSAEFDKAFESCDMILSPTTPTVAYRIGEKNDPVSKYMGDVYTVPASIAGVPVLSIPCGKDASGLPIGMQLIGKRFDEALIYRVGFAFEREGE